MSKFGVGKLKFKEGVSKPSYISKKMRKLEQAQQKEQEMLVHQDKLINYQARPGTGTITTSGRTIHGNDTKFRQELQRGDSIIIQNPLFKTTEERAVTLILSDKSILLQQPFLQEYSSFVIYQIKKKTKVIKGEDIGEKYKQQLLQLQKTKGIKKEEMSVRIKKGMWQYVDEKIQIDSNLTREQLLDKRQKLIKDKHCW